MKSERSYPIYKVNKKAEASLVGGHPWVYENDILEFPEAEPENGTLADVVSPKGAYLGTGFVSLKSKIRVRLISRNANDTRVSGRSAARHRCPRRSPAAKYLFLLPRYNAENYLLKALSSGICHK